MPKKLVIIGGGVSGLSAGCYGAMNGYAVEIHEAHILPGGLCTAWTRNGYTVDGCIHWLTGTRPGDDHYRIWQELGVIAGHPMLNHAVFAHVVSRDGRTLHWFADLDRLEDHLMDLAPRDQKASRRLCRQIRGLASLQMPVDKPAELRGVGDKVRNFARMAPYLRHLAPLADRTLGDLSLRFTDPLLRGAIANFVYDPGMPALALMLTLGPMSRKSAGYPMGGSLAVARTLERRLLGLGGRIHYRSRVTKVLERAGRAVGVRLESGDEVPADHVIAACDLRSTLGSLLNGDRAQAVHRELLDRGRLFAPLYLVHFGYDGVLPDEISCTGTSYELDNPLELAGRRRTFFVVKSSAHDPSLTPQGTSVVGSGGPTDWSHWEPLTDDRPAYDAAKQRLAEICLEQIELRYPGFSAKVGFTDVATPHTFNRYTDNWQGVYMTWNLPSEFHRRHAFVPKAVRGLAGFHIASMWTYPPGGVVGATAVGRGIIQILCRDDRQEFTTSMP